MRKLLIALFAICAITANAQWRAVSRQVSVRTNNFETLGELVDTNTPPYAPSNSVQALFEWIDDNWIGFSTNSSYTYADSTTQNVYRLIVRDDADVLGNLSITGNLTVAGTITGNGLGVDTNASYTYADGTTQSFDNVEIRGNLTSTNEDRSVSFDGYPRIPLDTSMVFIATSGAGTPISTNSFDQAFDNDLSTVTIDSTYDAGIHSYEIDLGAVYSGHLMITASASNATVTGYMVMSLYSGIENTTYSGGAPQNFSGADGNGNGIVWDNTGAGYVTNNWTIPFTGRYVGAFFYETGAGESTANVNGLNYKQLKESYKQNLDPQKKKKKKNKKNKK
jgi:hypothetical protein